MKKAKLTLCASVLAIAGVFAVPALHAAAAKSEEVIAAEKADRKAKKEAKDAENLAKYDANKNGKLDNDEKAAMRADDAKAKADRKAKKDAEKEKKDKDKGH